MRRTVDLIFYVLLTCTVLQAQNGFSVSPQSLMAATSCFDRVGDIDGDGDDDIVSFGCTQLSYSINNGGGVFSPPVPIYPPVSA